MPMKEPLIATFDKNESEKIVEALIALGYDVLEKPTYSKSEASEIAWLKYYVNFHSFMNDFVSKVTNGKVREIEKIYETNSKNYYYENMYIVWTKLPEPKVIVFPKNYKRYGMNVFNDILANDFIKMAERGSIELKFKEAEEGLTRAHWYFKFPPKLALINGLTAYMEARILLGLEPETEEVKIKMPIRRKEDIAELIRDFNRVLEEIRRTLAKIEMSEKFEMLKGEIEFIKTKLDFIEAELKTVKDRKDIEELRKSLEEVREEIKRLKR